MQKNDAAIVFSAGDLVGHLNCRYLTHLDLRVLQGELAKPKVRDDPTLDALVERGKTHEQGFVDHLAKQGSSVAVIAGVGIDDASVGQTRQAMARGDAVIVQAALRDGHWSGRADVLRRVEIPSGLGAWSYEVTDTKLARETKGNTVLQLSLYSDLLATMGGLTFLGVFGGTVKAPIHRYKFTVHETDVRANDDLKSVGGDKLGSVVAISNDDRTIDIKKRQDTASFHPEAVFAHKFVDNQVLAESIFRIGEHVANHGITGPGLYRAARDLLLKVTSRLSGRLLEQVGEPSVATAIRAALSLDQSVFPVQGSPGTGKTHAGARKICALVRDKRTVGVTANSHKVVRHLLDKSLEAAGEQRLSLQGIQKVSDEPTSLPGLQLTTKNPDFITGIGNGCQIGGATGWFWARPDAAGLVDVLFVDEAAQMSLANVLAVSQAAESIVLLGDPRQLEQPMQGSHPDGVAVSALDHVLGEHATIEADRGLFLEETWRLHPDICAFTSELFYEGRLRSRAGLERQEIRSSSRVNGAGIRYLAVQHEGNQNSSPEEADEIKRLVDEILSSKATWVDGTGKETAIGLEDILIIASYNAQVFELQERLPGARIGTVDKFQGQEALIAIYSMTTSSHTDAPRGMEFLYSLNRLNVATSRAKGLCILVASPQVFEAECRTPGQMQLVNAFCRYLERASTL
ncbi:AAA domain-containing protein [Bradyrhizobium japonicum]|uniref:AAA domain-containing protein n=1 Tax=Bradyrhizobium japonicum TaxID=375 RepID=UPI00040964E5|nr:AAA domain-containing protein [Bradyrhizobium japonicum]